MAERPSLRGAVAKQGNRYRDYALVAVFTAEVLFWTLQSPAFLTLNNLLNIARQASTIGIMAVGMTYVILIAGIDLSVGSLVSFTGMLIASTLIGTDSLIAALAVALGFGAVSGLFSGYLVSRLHVPAFIATLSLMQVYLAGAQLWNDGGPLSVTNSAVLMLGSGYIGPVPVPVVVFAVILLCGHWALSQSIFGRHVYAIGGNPEAARLAGIPVRRVTLTVYALSGALAGLAALLFVGRLATASPLTGTGLELQVIAAVIVGGCSLFGGKGNLRDTLLGVLVLTMLQNGLTLVGVSGFWQNFATGVAVLLAVLLSGDVLAKMRKKEA
ncbi:ABC transporter permease [Streptomyces canus]|uniref:ABC transporter permease n=1 Tax=Streptomyces canus TaxID=58343 RepID=UPI0036923683